MTNPAPFRDLVIVLVPVHHKVHKESVKRGAGWGRRES